MPNSSADVVVIGGGVNGTSIAMHLARMGAGKVLLVDRGHLAGGATGRSGAMVRQHYLHPTLVNMATEASRIFHNFADAIGGDARFKETGRLLLFGEKDEPAARANVEMNQELGVNIHMLTPTEVSELVPQLMTDGIVLGVYEPDAGHADPMATTYAFASQAEQRGVEIRTGCAVESIRVAGGRVVGVQTEEGLIETNTVVAATGPWSNKLAVPLGEPLPITPIRVQMVHMRRPPSLESFTTIVIDYTTGMYVRKNAGFKSLVGGESKKDLGEVVNPDGYGLNADHDTIERYWDRAKSRIPEFKPLQPPWAGTVPSTTWPRTAIRSWTGRRQSTGCTGRWDSADTGSSCPLWWAAWWRSSSCTGKARTTRSVISAPADSWKAIHWKPNIPTRVWGTSEGAGVDALLDHLPRKASGPVSQLCHG